MAYYLISGTIGRHTGYTQDFEKVIWGLPNSARKQQVSHRVKFKVFFFVLS